MLEDYLLKTRGETHQIAFRVGYLLMHASPNSQFRSIGRGSFASNAKANTSASISYTTPGLGATVDFSGTDRDAQTSVASYPKAFALHHHKLLPPAICSARAYTWPTFPQNPRITATQRNPVAQPYSCCARSSLAGPCFRC